MKFFSHKNLLWQFEFYTRCVAESYLKIFREHIH